MSPVTAAVVAALFAGGAASARAQNSLPTPPQPPEMTANSAVAWSPDGKALATAPLIAKDNDVRLWDPATGEVARRLAGHTDRVTAVAYSPDGKLLASAGLDDTVRLWDPATGELVRTLSGHERWVNALAWSPDGKLLASGSTDRTVRLWDPATGKAVRTLEGAGDWVLCLAFSPDGKRLAAGGADNLVRLWDPAAGRLERTLTGHTRWVRTLAFAPDGRLITGSLDGTLAVWEPASGRRLASLEAGKGWVMGVAASPDGKLIASAGMDTAINLYDTATFRRLRRLERRVPWPSALAFSPDGALLAAASTSEYGVSLWETRSWRMPEHARIRPSISKSVTAVVFSPDGRRMAMSRDEGIVTVWDAAGGREELRLKAHEESADDVAFTPDGRHILTSGHRESVRVWDAKDGRLLRELPGTSAYYLAISPDGRRVATTARAGSAESVKVFSTADWTLERTLPTPRHSRVYDILFSPDGRWLAAATGDRAVTLWAAGDGTWERRSVAGGMDRLIHSLAFAPDGKLLATANSDVRLWDPASGALVSVFDGDAPNAFVDVFGDYNPDVVRPRKFVAFSPDGKRLAVAHMNKTLRLFDLADPAHPKLARTAGEGEFEIRPPWTERVGALAYRPDGGGAVVGLIGGVLEELDFATGKRRKLTARDSVITSRFGPAENK